MKVILFESDSIELFHAKLTVDCLCLGVSGVDVESNAFPNRVCFALSDNEIVQGSESALASVFR